MNNTAPKLTTETLNRLRNRPVQATEKPGALRETWSAETKFHPVCEHPVTDTLYCEECGK